MMPWDLAARLDRDLPTHLSLPSGRAAIDYAESPPLASAKAQAFYGMAETPKLAGGQNPAAAGAAVARRAADSGHRGPRRLLERRLGGCPTRHARALPQASLAGKRCATN